MFVLKRFAVFICFVEQSDAAMSYVYVVWRASWITRKNGAHGAGSVESVHVPEGPD